MQHRNMHHHSRHRHASSLAASPLGRVPGTCRYGLTSAAEVQVQISTGVCYPGLYRVFDIQAAFESRLALKQGFKGTFTNRVQS